MSNFNFIVVFCKINIYWYDFVWMLGLLKNIYYKKKLSLNSIVVGVENCKYVK